MKGVSTLSAHPDSVVYTPVLLALLTVCTRSGSVLQTGLPQIWERFGQMTLRSMETQIIFVKRVKNIHFLKAYKILLTFCLYSINQHSFTEKLRVKDPIILEVIKILFLSMSRAITWEVLFIFYGAQHKTTEAISDDSLTTYYVVPPHYRKTTDIF